MNTEAGNSSAALFVEFGNGKASGKAMWEQISSAPFDRDLELAVLDRDGAHPLVFPCRRLLTGWIKSETRERVEVSPTHWREWSDDRNQPPHKADA